LSSLRTYKGGQFKLLGVKQGRGNRGGGEKAGGTQSGQGFKKWEAGPGGGEERQPRNL